MKQKIDKIEKFTYQGPVFNVEVKPNHSVQDDQYFVQNDTGIVVHNCHPRDNIALRSMAEKLDLGYDLFDAVMVARDKQAENMAKKLVSYGLPVVIVGKSYKPGVPYSAGSVSILTGEYVKLNGGIVFYIDYDKCDDKRDDQPVDLDGPLTYLMAHSNAVTYDDARIANLVLSPAPGSVIVDPWRKHPDVPGVTVIHYGNTRTS